MAHSRHIRLARRTDIYRIAEILVFNNRMVLFPIFQDENYSFNTFQVHHIAMQYQPPDVLQETYVYDDGIIRAMARIHDGEICKLYTDYCFHGRGIGGCLFQYLVQEKGCNRLWVVEPNLKAVRFYEHQGFVPSGRRQFEEGTNIYLIEMVRPHPPV